ncbi:MAG TPA: hypothetical protein VK558_10130 [Patescibacteria group bacterium]|nr:hypothetical protein [Patescibacteria group bacterium]
MMYNALQATPLPEPAQGRDLLRTGPFIQRAETALRGWTQMMSKMRAFDVSRRHDIYDEEFLFFTLWYSGRAEAAPFDVPELESDRWLDGHYPFLFRRAHLSVPPRNFVHTDEGQPDGRLLNFLDHGDPVHERLVQGFVQIMGTKLGADKTPQSLVVQFPEGHPALQLQEQTILVVVAWTDPGNTVLPAFPNSKLTALVDAASTDAQKRDLIADVRLAQESWRADQRWVRSLLPAQIFVEAAQINGPQWNSLPNELAVEFLKPLVYRQDGVLCARGRQGMTKLPGDVASRVLRDLQHRMAKEFSGTWREPITRLEESLKCRHVQVEAECRDTADKWGAEIERRKAMKAGAAERAKEGLVAAAERRLEMAETIRNERLHWLAAIPELAAQARLQKVASLILKPAPMEQFPA